MLHSLRKSRIKCLTAVIIMGCMLIALFPAAGYCTAQKAQDFENLKPAEKLGLLITGPGAIQGQDGFNGNFFILTESQLERIKTEKSTSSIGINNGWIENKAYSSHDNHGLGEEKGYYHYSLTSGLSIKDIFDGLNIPKESVKNCFYYASDYSGTIDANQGIYTNAYYFAPGEKVSTTEALAMLALYKTTYTTKNQEEGIVPQTAEKLEPGNNVMVYGQLSADEDNNCRFAKHVDTIAINKAPEGIRSDNNNSRAGIEELMRLGIYRTAFSVANGKDTGEYNLEGVPLQKVMETLGIAQYLKDYSSNKLTAISTSGEIEELTYADLNKSFVAWDYTDDKKPSDKQTTQLALFTPNGVLNSLTKLVVKDKNGAIVTSVPQKPAPQAPGAPASFKAVKKSYNSIKLTWKKSSAADGYNLYRYNTKTKTYQRLKTLSVGSTAYTDSGLATNTTYKYRIKSFIKANGKTYEGSYSKETSAKPTLDRGTITKLSKNKKTAVTIRWKKVSGASGYQIYRATKKSGKYKKAATVKKSKATSYTNKKLKRGKTYYYKVRPYRIVNGKYQYGSFSKIKRIKR